MAEASSTGNLTDDVIIIPDTPSPVFSRRTVPIEFKRRQPSVNISPVRRSNSSPSVKFSPSTSVDFNRRQPSVNISPIRSSNSSPTVNFSPPGGALSLPGQGNFAIERAEAIRQKKAKDKLDRVSDRLGDSGLSPVKRLSPDKAGFVKSSTLLNRRTGSSPSNKTKTASALDSLKRDVSRNMYYSSPTLYDRIKVKQKNKVHNKASTKTGRYGWPSDSDSSEDEILARAVESASDKYKSLNRKTSCTNLLTSSKLSNSSQSKKKGEDIVQLFQDSDDDFDYISADSSLKNKVTQNSKSATQTSSKSPGQCDTVLNGPSSSGLSSPTSIHSGKDRPINTNMSPSPDKLLNKMFRTDCNTERSKTKFKHPEWCGAVCKSSSGASGCDKNCNKKISPSPDKLLNKMFRTDCNTERSKTKFKHPEWCGAVCKSSSGASGCDKNCNKKISPGLASLTAICSNLSSESGSITTSNTLTDVRSSNNSNTTGSKSSVYSAETGSDRFAKRLERKRKQETERESSRGLTKVPKFKGNTKPKMPVKDRISVSSDDATPETKNVISVVSQLEKDEEIARKLQEELDREFALHLQDHSEAARSRSDSAGQESEEGEYYRYHSPFGDIGHHQIDSPSVRRHRRPRGHSPMAHNWHLFDPLMAASRRRRRDEPPAGELEELMADAANSFLAGLDYELMMGGGRRQRGRQARGGRAGGVFNLMFSSPNNSGNDYDALMELGEILGDAKSKGLSKHELQRLPTTVYKTDENNPCTECHICMGDYEDGDSLKILPCFHNYHSTCIDKWIKQNATCPVCRVEIKLG